MKTFKITATTLFGLEKVLADEIKKIGGEHIRVQNRAVYYVGDKEVLYKSNLYLRTALKILVPLKIFKAHNEKSLYKYINNIEWDKHFSNRSTMAVESVVNSRHFKHSKYASLKTKDAIVDYFMDNTGKRPNIDTIRPHVRVHIHIDNEECTISLDASGDSLHKRGYRKDKNEAPLNEVLAAGLVMLTGWKGEKPFYDPMCGSGTIAIEAGMIAKKMAPNLRRNYYTFKYWNNYDAELWKSILREAKKSVIDSPVPIRAGDIDSKSLDASRANIERAGLEETILVSKKNFFDIEPKDDEGIIVMNPPYGERLKNNEIDEFYEKVGDKLKNSFAGFEAWILSSNFMAMKHIGLRTSQKLKLYNGSLACKYHKYEMYQGSKKKKYREGAE